MKMFTIYSLVLVGLFCCLLTAYAADKTNLLFIMPGIIAANNNTDCEGVRGGTAVVDACGVCGGNGSSCSVSTVISASQVWMDRNLGASRVATSSTDSEAYGDLYQWGRGTDGHEKRTSATTTTLSGDDTPGHGDFIISEASPYDWRTPQNHTLWQGVSGINNPCPAGFRLPTETELETERASWGSNDAAGAYASSLKLVVAGYRTRYDGTILSAGSSCNYWSSTVRGTLSHQLNFNSSLARMLTGSRAYGFSVRCLQD